MHVVCGGVRNYMEIYGGVCKVCGGVWNYMEGYVELCRDMGRGM